LGVGSAKRCERSPSSIDDDHLAGLDLAHVGGTDDVEGGRLRGDDPAAFEPADDEGADAVGIASGIQRVFVHEDEAERAAQSGQHVEGRGLEGAVGVVGQEGRDERGVGGVAPRELAAVGVSLERRPSTRSRSSAEFVRLPLWASATVPPAWPPRVGWAFSHVEPPVVE
jgi:hypothetical protein